MKQGNSILSVFYYSLTLSGRVQVARAFCLNDSRLNKKNEIASALKMLGWFLFVGFLALGCSESEIQDSATPAVHSIARNSLNPLPDSQSAVASNDTLTEEISYQLIPGINNTWGYDILVDKRISIHQTTPPGMPGNEGFKTKAGAESVAKLVISKMQKGEMPPSITVDEMKKLKAI